MAHWLRMRAGAQKRSVPRQTTLQEAMDANRRLKTEELPTFGGYGCHCCHSRHYKITPQPATPHGKRCANLWKVLATSPHPKRTLQELWCTQYADIREQASAAPGALPSGLRQRTLRPIVSKYPMDFNLMQCSSQAAIESILADTCRQFRSGR